MALYQFNRYFVYQSISAEGKPIKYVYVARQIHKGGRGEYYTMIISYKEEQQTIDITSKNYWELEKNIFPVLFYSKSDDTIFGNWVIKLKFRLAVLFFVAFLITFLPLKYFKQAT
jgi:hypothetical protein